MLPLNIMAPRLSNYFVVFAFSRSIQSFCCFTSLAAASLSVVHSRTAVKVCSVNVFIPCNDSSCFPLKPCTLQVVSTAEEFTFLPLHQYYGPRTIHSLRIETKQFIFLVFMVKLQVLFRLAVLALPTTQSEKRQSTVHPSCLHVVRHAMRKHEDILTPTLPQIKTGSGGRDRTCDGMVTELINSQPTLANGALTRKYLALPIAP